MILTDMDIKIVLHSVKLNRVEKDKISISPMLVVSYL